MPKKRKPAKAKRSATTAAQSAAMKPARAKRRAKRDPESQPAELRLLVIEPLTATPDVPDSLDDVGRRYWMQVAPLLVEHRLLTLLDLSALEALAHAWSEYVAWQKKLQANPALAIVEYEKGARQISPEAVLRDKAFLRWLKIAPRFGLSPEAMRKLDRLAAPAGGKRSSKGASRAAQQDTIAEFASGKTAAE